VHSPNPIVMIHNLPLVKFWVLDCILVRFVRTSNINLTMGSDVPMQSREGDDMHMVLKTVNLIKFGLEHHPQEGEKDLDTHVPTMTQMTEIMLATSGIDPCDPHLHNPCHCHALNNIVNRENRHPNSHTFLDKFPNTTKNDRRGHSTIRNDAHNQIQLHFTGQTKTPISMISTVACPNLPLTSRDDAATVPDRPMKLTLPQQKGRSTKTQRNRNSPPISECRH
jgi:hypothetical protein